MGRLAVVKAFIRTVVNGAKVGEVTADVGGGLNYTGGHMTPPGDDSQPLPGDNVALMRGVGANQYLAVGYVDPNSDPVAGAGEKRIYARDSSGAVQCAVWLQSSGAIVITNDAGGTIVMIPTGDILINGVTIDTSGNVTLPASAAVSADSVVADGKELVDHTHAVTTAPGTTGPNQ